MHLNSSSHVDITGNCGTSTTNAILKISWPKNETFYTLIMEFQNSSSSHSWSVISIVFNVTVEGNPAFENITGTFPLFSLKFLRIFPSAN